MFSCSQPYQFSSSRNLLIEPTESENLGKNNLIDFVSEWLLFVPEIDESNSDWT